MNKYHPDNERMKRQYLFYLKHAQGRSVDSVDDAAAAMARFEEYTKYKDFKIFHPKQATSFKDHLAKQNSQTTGKKLSRATLNGTLSQLKRFFEWLSDKPGYKSRLLYSDAAFFNLSEKDVRIANARLQRPVPTLEQILLVIAMMPCGTDIELRDRAVVTIILLTGARDMAVATLKLKHIDLVTGRVFQDAREVRTKNSKTFVTFLFPFNDTARQILVDWVHHLRHTLLWGDDDPLFPSTRMELNCSLFQAVGLERKHWSTATPIRTIFRTACARAGLPYFNPHSVRFTVARLGQKLCGNGEELKALSQNLGHEHLATTLISYGTVSDETQGEIIRRLGEKSRKEDPRIHEIAKSLAREALRLGADESGATRL